MGHSTTFYVVFIFLIGVPLAASILCYNWDMFWRSHPLTNAEFNKLNNGYVLSATILGIFAVLMAVVASII